MIVLRVHVNDEPLTVAGADDLGVLNAIVNAVGKLGSASHSKSPDESPDLHLTVGGLTSRAAGVQDEHLRWVSHRELRVGDRILVEVLEAPTADPAESGHEARQREHDEREYFEHCKKAYLDLKAKYETPD